MGIKIHLRFSGEGSLKEGRNPRRDMRSPLSSSAGPLMLLINSLGRGTGTSGTPAGAPRGMAFQTCALGKIGAPGLPTVRCVCVSTICVMAGPIHRFVCVAHLAISARTVLWGPTAAFCTPTMSPWPPASLKLLCLIRAGVGAGLWSSLCLWFLSLEALISLLGQVGNWSRNF